MGLIDSQEFPFRKVYGCQCQYCLGNVYFQKLPDPNLVDRVCAIPDGWCAYLVTFGLEAPEITIPFRSGCLVQRFGKDVAYNLPRHLRSLSAYGVYAGFSIFMPTEDELIIAGDVPKPAFANENSYWFDPGQAFPDQDANGAQVFQDTGAGQRGKTTYFLGMQPNGPAQAAKQKYKGMKDIVGEFASLKTIPRTAQTGQKCTLCGEYNEYAEPNRPDGSFQCRRHRI